jgi:hypothetical protein
MIFHLRDRVTQSSIVSDLCFWRQKIKKPWKFLLKIIFIAFITGIESLRIQSYLYLHTQLVKNGCTYCEKYLNQNMDFHRLTCEVI